MAAAPPVAWCSRGAPSAARNEDGTFRKVVAALQQEAIRSSNANVRLSRYNTVRVLLVGWEHDDMGVSVETNALASVFGKDFGFEVEKFTIPVEKPRRSLNRTMSDWVEAYDHPDNLFILYYAGHGRLSDSGRSVVWHNRRIKEDDRYQEVKWSGCEDLLDEAESDTLFIFDCCHAAGTASTGFKGVSQTICASGFESIAPLPGPHSFTAALIYVLRQMARYPRPFSVSVLYTAILAYLKDLDPTQIAPDGFRIADSRDHILSIPRLRKPEYRRTPVHFVRTNHHQSPDIQLFPCFQRKDFSATHQEGPLGEKRSSSSAITVSVYTSAGLTATDAESARRWLRNIPLPTERIMVQSTFNDQAEGSIWKATEITGRGQVHISVPAAREVQEWRRTVDQVDLMHRIAERTEKGIDSMYIITVMPLFFLPSTFVATMVSSDIFSFHEAQDSDNLVFKSYKLRLYLRLTGLLMFLSLVIWGLAYWLTDASKNRRMKRKYSI